MISNFEQYITKHLVKLQNINDVLDKVDVANTDYKFDDLKQMVTQIADERNYINNKCTVEDLRPYKEDLKKMIKQIREKFDNIVETNRNIQADLKKDLNQLVNKRKLANYQR